MKCVHIAMVLVLALPLSACGFHLRRSLNLPTTMQRTYIADTGGNTELVRVLRRNLTTQTTAVTNDGANATAVLHILDSQRFQRVLSVSNTGQPLEYQVAYQVKFALTTASGKMLISPQKLTLTRDYVYDAANVIGDTEQADVLYNALEDNMAQLILFRIQAANRSSKGAAHSS
jgi:LPS-assembly lipoprotein